MVEYSVILERFEGSARPDVCIFRDESREKAIKAMRDYDAKNGFSIYDADGHFTIADILLVEKEPVVGAPVLSVTPYCELFDCCGNRKKEEKPHEM